MEGNRTQFTFYESFYKAVSRIKKKAERIAAFEMLCRYSLYGELPELDELPNSLAAVFFECQPLMDLDRRQSIEGRHCIEYKAWRKAVFERDNYTCQVCGARGVKVNAHHRKEYAFYPELRYDLDNGVTLCVPCHKKVHRRKRHGN